MGIIDKYDYALSITRTPFVTVCGDDDFIVLSTVSECSTFLAANEEYSHAHGRIITFWEKRSITNPVKSLRNYVQFSNELNVCGRLATHFSMYANNFYSVHRTELLCRNFRKVNALDIGRGLKERLIAALDIADGKRKMVDGLFILRQKGLTGMDESGRRTFDDDPADHNYFDQISFGYQDYLLFLRNIFADELSLDQSQVQMIMDCVEQDYRQWRAKRTSAIASKNAHVFSILEMPRQAYRNMRDYVNVIKIRSALNASDRKALDLAIAAMREFYAFAGRNG